MAAGDSQEVIGAYVVGQSYDALHGVGAVKAAAGYARLVYQQGFKFVRKKEKANEIKPVRFRMGHPRPNPFNEGMNVEVEIPRECNISIAVYDARGRLVRVLHKGFSLVGTYRYHWDGLDQSGVKAASGIYLIRFIAPSIHGIRKVVYLR